MVLPVIVITIMATMGLLLPADSGEKMGLQITVLLTMVIFVEVLQTNIPVFGFLDKTPVILVYFIVTILLLCFCLLLTTFTLFLHHINEYESKNFSKTEGPIGG